MADIVDLVENQHVCDYCLGFLRLRQEPSSIAKPDVDPRSVSGPSSKSRCGDHPLSARPGLVDAEEGEGLAEAAGHLLGGPLDVGPAGQLDPGDHRAVPAMQVGRSS